MTDWLIMLLMFLGALFCLLAAVGIIRMPDFYSRISTTTKAATLGVGLILIATALHFSQLSITTRILAILLFLVLTAPVSAHLIVRASYIIGEKLWKKSMVDALKNMYSKNGEHLKSDKKE